MQIEKAVVFLCPSTQLSIKTSLIPSLADAILRTFFSWRSFCIPYLTKLTNRMEIGRETPQIKYLLRFSNETDLSPTPLIKHCSANLESGQNGCTSLPNLHGNIYTCLHPGCEFRHSSEATFEEHGLKHRASTLDILATPLKPAEFSLDSPTIAASSSNWKMIGSYTNDNPENILVMTSLEPTAIIPPVAIAGGNRIPCISPSCDRTFSRKADMRRHARKHNPAASPTFPCGEADCKINTPRCFTRKDKLIDHVRKKHISRK